MSSPTKTDPTRDLLELLPQLKKTFEDVDKDVKKTIDLYSKNQFQLDTKSQQELSPRFRSIREELIHINEFLGQRASEANQEFLGQPASEANQHDFQALSETELNIVNHAEEDHLSKTTAPSRFDSIREELDQINKILGRRASDFNQEDFPALSETELDIIDDAEEDPLVKRLRVSYEFFFGLDELKRDPRICLFLAIFPRNAVLRKRFLIYWWIGEGLVPHEEEGERVFEELLDLELLIPHGKCPRVSKCQISPWVRCMLIALAKKERLLDIKDGIPRFDLAHSRRTCLISGHPDLGIEGESTLPETLRTIFNVNERDLHFQDQWLAKLKRLVVLQLGRWQVSPTHHIEVQDESFLTGGLKTQKLLKYLSLRGISRITSLPDSIRELVSLEILDLKACHNLENLPDAVASLKKLTHLDVSECYLMESLPKGLHNLTPLQVLKGFIIGNSQKTLIRLEHLPHLKTLKRLSIHIGSEATIQKDDFDNLKDLPEVKCLKISWGRATALQSVSFPPELQKLDLEGIPHETMPEWLKPSKLMNLETLYIKGGKLRNLPNKGEQWNNVKYFVLKYTKMPTINQETLKRMFPSLQYLKKVEWVSKRGEQEKVEFEWP
ncbi:disease resistance RPP13-like protein 4 [Neltuma alba]|uniref:disease resistance RPP13-like protein 4 n=1 Tax=Neltuma alba TaxID=207710 RepID=UPI0010A31830|nr:disease resistance RPP13-like protein 4 [Prosopis alba]